ncbi:hypothetical protein, partial [Escherichia coli]|uniref:hypothetical protein n=1 Tax=Escherichia coli TaxID=562 RepID=UPI0019D485C6
CQTARCFNKSKGVLITGSKLKAFRNPQPSWGFSVHNKNATQSVALLSAILRVFSRRRFVQTQINAAR